MEDLLSFLKDELNRRADEIASGMPERDPGSLAMAYQYRVGIVHGLVLVRDWVKEKQVQALRSEILEESD